MVCGIAGGRKDVHVLGRGVREEEIFEHCVLASLCELAKVRESPGLTDSKKEGLLDILLTKVRMIRLRT